MPNTAPLILAFDTSVAHCAAALVSGDQVLQSAQEVMAKGQAERLLGLCQDMLAASGRSFQDLDAIGVCTGPGNFTGVRISVSAARGLALPLGIPAVGVSAFDALQFGHTGPCVCTTDARRDQVYLKGYDNPELTEPALYALDNLPVFEGPMIGAFGATPTHPIAIATAFVAAQRLSQNPTPPQPMYLRPADAAPARDAPPHVIP